MRFLLYLTLFIIFFTGCSYAPPAPIAVEKSSEKIDYMRDIKPILDRRCVTCHSCYNAPCQAKFSSFEGLERGGSKKKVYLAERLFSQEPTRLFIDAKTTQQWRKKNFFSLTEDTAVEGFNNSIMGHMLYDKKKNPEVIGEYAPEYDELLCPKTLEEMSEYLDDKENHGMPYGFPALDEKEYKLIMSWLVEGAYGPSQADEKKLKTPSEKAQLQIDKWEKFLNKPDAKHKLTSRYLYEHYFLAHINFEEDPKEFYRLVRSSTPPGHKINELNSLRPYDDPKVKKFYYRFLKIHSTLVHKTHMTVIFDKEELSYINKLFIKSKWLEAPNFMDYEVKKSANPFVLYAQIPPKIRYKFLLDKNEYFVRTFIRGPVCKGQIALGVIHDHFWVMFQDPESDIGVMRPGFLIEQADNLATPIEVGSDKKIYQVFSDAYRKKYKHYYNAKLKEMEGLMPSGMHMNMIWKGSKASDSPALSVYRHFDSASVHKGLIGGLPKTMWVIDYAHFERIYYSLVAGFDVFGNVSHQTNIRRYMDFLRLEGEVNFLTFLPKNKRQGIFSSWYIGDKIAKDVQTDTRNLVEKISTQIVFKSKDPKQEFIESLVQNHFLKKTNIHFDENNYFTMGEEIPSLPSKYEDKVDFKQAVRALSRPGSGFVKHIVDNGVNLAFIRIHEKNGREKVLSLVVNRWHDNVNSLFSEEDRRDPNKDHLDILEGTVGSYPNLFFDLNKEEVPDFFDMLMNFDNSELYRNKIKKYGVSRSDENFWGYYDWFQEQFIKNDPMNAGLYDLNRYYRQAW